MRNLEGSRSPRHARPRLNWTARMVAAELWVSSTGWPVDATRLPSIANSCPSLHHDYPGLSVIEQAERSNSRQGDLFDISVSAGVMRVH